jgi:hypothetical protein
MKGATCITCQRRRSEYALFQDAKRSTKQGKYGNVVKPGERAGLRLTCARSQSARQLCRG